MTGHLHRADHSNCLFDRRNHHGPCQTISHWHASLDWWTPPPPPPTPPARSRVSAKPAPKKPVVRKQPESWPKPENVAGLPGPRKWLIGTVQSQQTDSYLRYMRCHGDWSYCWRELPEHPTDPAIHFPEAVDLSEEQLQDLEPLHIYELDDLEIGFAPVGARSRREQRAQERFGVADLEGA